MGRQTRFYAHPDDYEGLAEGLRSNGAVTIDHEHSAGEPVIVDLAKAGGSINAFLTRPEYLGELRARYTGHQNWRLSVHDDPIVELHIWQPPRAGLIRPGRVYYQARRVVELEYVDQPAEFVAFAEQVRRWLRRWCRKSEDLWLAPSLAARFDRGQIVRDGTQGNLRLLG